jgi:hypothetical protein
MLIKSLNRIYLLTSKNSQPPWPLMQLLMLPKTPMLSNTPMFPKMPMLPQTQTQKPPKPPLSKPPKALHHSSSSTPCSANPPPTKRSAPNHSLACEDEQRLAKPCKQAKKESLWSRPLKVCLSSGCFGVRRGELRSLLLPWQLLGTRGRTYQGTTCRGTTC